ncbi:uncharacterized protein LOC114282352 [Camellia sinensis]|uniref:uncharacterized protein LOC114282352 n=1 Tax=Camellia sinensis TaxID=4442 RepID=UPI0010358D44|nr:uncharacterized protein LOC114282352 [Camellia sinensis]
MSEEIDYVCQESSARLLASPKRRAVDDGEVGIQTSGLIKTLSGPDNMDCGLKLIVDLKSTHECYGSDEAPVLDPQELITTKKVVVGGPDGRVSSLFEAHDKEPSSSLSRPTQGKEKIRNRRKSNHTFLGKKSFDLLRKYESKGASTSRAMPKAAVWRAAVAARSSSASMEGGIVKGRFAFNEAEETLKMGEVLGTIFNQFNCAILNIYAPNDVGSRGNLWDCLLKLKEEFPNPWCLGGDFNEIRQIEDRRGCSRRDRGMKEFNEFIDKCEISDLPLLGRRFTWCNSFGGEKWSKIDRIFVDPKWLEIFNLKLWGSPRLVSDHCPLLMMEDERDWGPKPFRKLKILKSGLRSWNVEVFGNIVNKLKTVEGELHKIDLLAEARDLDDDDEKGKRREVRAEMWSLSRMVEWLWLQKSRLNWAMKGDKNTRFFHVVTKCRTIRNELHSITEGDVVYEEPRQVKNKVMEYFKNQYTELWLERPKLGGHFPSADGRVRFDLLETEFSEAEIKLVVMECDSNKAPEPDGFNMLCFQKFWKVMKGEVVTFVNEFHRNGRSQNFLANRLKSVMPHIISEPQSAFLSGRNILNGVLIANEVVEGWKKAKRKGVLIKLDFEKAYDSINWGFLFSMLSKFGFGAKWIN